MAKRFGCVLSALLLVSLPVYAQAPAAHSVVIMGRLTLKPGQEQAFQKLAAQMSERVKREDHGNLRYQFYRAAALGPPGGVTKTVWVFVEEWSTQADAAAHAKWATPIVREQWRAMTDAMQLMRLTPIDVSE